MGDPFLVKKLGIRLFGNIVSKHLDKFEFLRRPLAEADMKVLLKSYVCMIFYITLLVFIFSFTTFLTISIILNFSLAEIIIFCVVLPMVLTSITFSLGIIYPITKANSRKKNIETNLPFAIAHMAAIASSGVPPSTMFRLLTGFEEYGEISKEAKKIVRNIDVFGQDITTALREVSNKTPSLPFKDFLEGVATTIDTGGNLQAFLRQQAEKALFEYRIRREKYLETLSTYADFYTAVLIAAPLFLVAILAVMNMIGGKLWGMEIETAMWLGISILMPIVNLVFLAFIHFTQPEL
jgi:flagellar protein FlaJ